MTNINSSVYNFFTKEKDKENTKFDQPSPKNIQKDGPFQLPIMYVKKEYLHILSKTVLDDLEYNKINHLLLTPLHEECNAFGNVTKKKGCQYITTDIDYLQDTQNIVKTIGSMTKQEKKHSDLFFTIWNDVHDKHFLEKYYYMDWEQLLYLNKHAQFLQFVSVANILSPLISLLLPLFIMIFPFVLLKLQGIQITTTLYFQVLKETARNHFIGKSMCTMESMSWDKLVYVFITFVIYILQIYQNTNTCIKYYRNVKNINANLLFIKTHISNTIQRMEQFVQQHQSKRSYQTFCHTVKHHADNLKPFLEDLKMITECQHIFYIPFKSN